MQHKRVEHPARAPAVVRVQDQPSCAHQDKLLLQRQRQQHQLGAQHGQHYFITRAARWRSARARAASWSYVCE